MVNVGLDENVELVLESIEKLGFNFADINLILNTQAHFDHAGGISRLAGLTGARVMAGSKDVLALRNGGINDYAFGDKLTFAAVRFY